MDYNAKLNFLRRILGDCKYSSGTKEALFFSPFCSHHKRKLSINLETDRWRCFISGNNGKKLLYVIRESGGSKSDLKEYIERYKSKDVVISARTNIDAAFKMEFPEYYSPLVNCKSSAIGRRAWKYLTSRGISDLDILRHKIGIVTSGDFAGRILFPSFSAEGKLNSFAARAYDGTYLTAPAPKGYINSIVLNELNIDWRLPVVLVEGAIDSYKSVSNTVPLFGSTIHDESLLFEKIVVNDTPIVLGFDADAQKKLDRLAKKLFQFNIDVYTVDLGGYKDIGEMSKATFAEIYAARSLWTPENSFRKKLRNLC